MAQSNHIIGGGGILKSHNIGRPLRRGRSVVMHPEERIYEYDNDNSTSSNSATPTNVQPTKTPVHRRMSLVSADANLLAKHDGKQHQLPNYLLNALLASSMSSLHSGKRVSVSFI
jgi:hypothetical protein